MIIRLLENDSHSGMQKGLREVSEALGRELISKGLAVLVKEKATDDDAHDALRMATARNQE